MDDYWADPTKFDDYQKELVLAIIKAFDIPVSEIPWDDVLERPYLLKFVKAAQAADDVFNKHFR